jgi:hypothetical protein
MSRDRHPMVGWFDPGQLARTGAEVLISSIFGRHADARVQEAHALPAGAPKFHDFSERAGEFVFDFVSDTGDGFDSTYAVARALAHVAEPGVRTDLLIFGGDQVYPAPTREAYQERLEDVYAAAYCDVADKPQVFAIPGNHDWYDSLVAFRRLFCTKRRFGGMPTAQASSYFALKLPARTWLFGVDIQLSSDIDGPQLNWFDALTTLELRGGDRVILIVPEPFWVYRARYPNDAAYSERNLDLLRQKIEHAGARIVAFVAGDEHHYARYASADPNAPTLLTAGGGGAFLHPTHSLPERVVAGASYELKSTFPARATSFALTFRNVGFALINWRFALLIGAFYATVSYLFGDPALAAQPTFMARFAHLVAGPIEPLGVIATVLTIGLVMLFTDTHRLGHRLIGGGLHGAAHLFAALALFALSETLLEPARPAWFGFATWSHLIAHVALVGSAGALLGATLVGLYLLISLNAFGRHSNEAFSALKIADYKNTLRFRIAENGALEVRVFTIKRVPRRWSDATPPQPLDRALEVIEHERLSLA